MDGICMVFNRYTEETIVRFDPSDGNAAALAQKTIYDSQSLNDEQKCYAHFWCGYFYAHATMASRV
jgi:hypothetical protein